MAFTTSGQETEWTLFLQPRSPHGTGGAQLNKTTDSNVVDTTVDTVGQ